MNSSENHVDTWYQIKDEADDTKLRPDTFSQFIGQSQLKDNLSLFIKAARQRQEPLEHVFLSGAPGLGKTTLAAIIAHELQADMKMTNAPVIDKPKDIIGILSTLTPNSVLFIDEIHRLRPAVEEILCVAMEDFMLDWIVGKGPDARTVRIPINPFTLIGATTKPSKISLPLHGRFGIKERIDMYDENELKNIVLRTAKILSITIEEEAALYIGSMSRGTPRYANRLVRRIRDFAQIQEIDTIHVSLVKSSLKSLGIDYLGLEELDRRILTILVKEYQGKPVGLKTLAMLVNESPEGLEDFWEHYLIRKGLLQRTPQGRCATPKAWEVLGISSDDSDTGLF